MKLLSTKSGATWRIYHVETPHSDYYMLEQAVPRMDGTSGWQLADLKCFVKPEFLASATKIQGDAIAQAQKDILAAAIPQPECPVCLGSKTHPDDPGKFCNACGGSGRKA